jgi:hypothetical protein
MSKLRIKIGTPRFEKAKQRDQTFIFAAREPAAMTFNERLVLCGRALTFARCNT